jgi:AraC family transcriptional regulator
LQPIPVELNRGLYLAPDYKNYDADGILAATTYYDQPIPPGLWHYHQNPMICFVLKGGNIEKRNGVEFERVPGRVTFYHAGEVHQNIYKVFPSRGFNLALDNEFFRKYSLSETNIYSSLNRNHQPQLILYKLYQELELKDDCSIQSAHMLLLSMISTCDDIKKRQSPKWFLLILEILHDRWNENISLEELALASDVHPTTISKYFTIFLQCTFGDYVRKLRVQKSLTLIQQPSTSLSEIAYQCGFADQSHFIRIFKHHTGFLPKQFQKL